MKSLKPRFVFGVFLLGWIFVYVSASNAAGDDLNKTIRAAEHAESSEDYGESIRLNSLLLSSPHLPSKDRPIVYYNRGLAYRATKQSELAIGDFSEAIRLKGDFAEAYMFRGAAHIDNGEAKEAIEDLKRAFQLKLPSKFLPEAHFVSGVAYVMNNEHQDALRELSKAIDLQPGFSAAYHQRGLVRAMIGEYKEALVDLDRAIKIQRSFAVAYSDRGFVYLQMGNLDRALEDLDKAISLGANDAATHVRRGVVLFKSKNTSRQNDAIADFDYAIRESPAAFPEAYAMRGRILQSKGDNDQAIDDYTTAIRLKPDYLKAYFDRALAYQTKGDWELAIKDFDHVIGSDSSNVSAYFLRGFSYAQEGAFSKAYADIDEAIHLSRNGAEHQFFLRTRGAIYFAEGKFDSALQDFEQALKVAPDDHHALLWLYLAEARLGKPLSEQLLDREVGRLDVKEWPDAAILFYAGKANSKDMKVATESNDVRLQKVKECEMSFFRGEYDLLQKDISGAKQLLRQASDICPNNSEVKIIAPRELQRIGG